MTKEAPCHGKNFRQGYKHLLSLKIAYAVTHLAGGAAPGRAFF